VSDSEPSLRISDGEEPAICPGCGILALAAESACRTCGAAYDAPPLRASRQPGGGYWVAVQARFTCGACNFESPLNHFALGEGVVCAHCGIEQRYEERDWQALVDLAHEVGDFGGGGPQGRFVDPRYTLRNPYPSLGRRSSWAEASRRAYQASPGNPLCGRCHAPVLVAEVQRGLLEVACSACDERRRYRLPPRALALDRLTGALADEHDDRAADVVMQEQSGVSVLACPSCAAPLEDAGDGDGVVTCTYCGAVCRISGQARAHVGGRQVRAKTWWLYFEGPSELRLSLLRKARDEAFDEDMRRRARQEQRAKAEAERQREEARARAKRARPTRKTPKPAPPVDPVEAKTKERRSTIFGILVGGVLPVVGSLVLWWALESGSVASDEPLQRLSLDMSPGEAGALFGVAPVNPLKVSFAPWHVIEKAELRCGDSQAYCDVRLRGGLGFDDDDARRRLDELAPHRVTAHQYQEMGLEYEVELVQSSLQLYTKHDDIRVNERAKRSERGGERARALWAAALYVAYGEPELSPEQLALISGPGLSELTRLDLRVDSGTASAAFTNALPDGVCDLGYQLKCTIDTNDPLVKSAEYAWPKEPEAAIEDVTMHLRDERLVGVAVTCLDRATGVAHQDAPRGWTEWKLGDGDGEVEMLEDMVVFRPPYHPGAGELAMWATQVTTIVQSLAGCGS